MSYNREAQKRYNERLVRYTIKYSLHDVDGVRLKTYMEKTGKSGSAVIREALHAFFDSQGVPYPDTLPKTQHDDLE